MDQFSFPFQHSVITDCPAPIRELMQAAQDAAKHAYAPYSNFKVGAAARLADGSIKTAANHENASYPAGVCAETTLIGGINPLEANQQVIAIAVTYLSETNPGVPLSPCGICRQNILEQQLAQQAPIAVYMGCPDGKILLVPDATSLLPFYFSNENLKLMED